MEYRDKGLVCVECHQEFVWTAGEQLFYHDRNFRNEPKRCKECKGRRHDGPGRTPRAREETATTCSQCGRATTVPFRPTQGRPILCQGCYASRKTARALH